MSTVLRSAGWPLASLALCSWAGLLGCTSPGPKDASGQTPAYRVIDLGTISVELPSWDVDPLAGTPFEPEPDPRDRDDLPEAVTRLLQLRLHGPPDDPPGSGVPPHARAFALDEQGRACGFAHHLFEDWYWEHTFVPVLFSQGETWSLDIIHPLAAGHPDIDRTPGQATDMNDQLGVVGVTSLDSFSSFYYSNHARAFHWDGVTGVYEILPLASGWADVGSMFAEGINAGAEIVGWARVDDIGLRAFRFVDGTTEELPGLPGHSLAFDISDSGTIVGVGFPGSSGRAVRWSGGTQQVLTELTDDDGEPFPSWALAISDGTVLNDEWVVGQSDDHAVRWDDEGEVLRLSPGEVDFSMALGVNIWGLVVGYGWPSTHPPVVEGIYLDGSHHAFVAPPYKDLNDLIDQDLDWVLLEAHDVNDEGWIVGHGNLAGERHAFLLVPWDDEGPAVLQPTGPSVVGAGG
jgi:hypothetical protein